MAGKNDIVWDDEPQGGDGIVWDDAPPADAGVQWDDAPSVDPGQAVATDMLEAAKTRALAGEFSAVPPGSFPRTAVAPSTLEVTRAGIAAGAGGAMAQVGGMMLQAGEANQKGIDYTAPVNPAVDSDFVQRVKREYQMTGKVPKELLEADLVPKTAPFMQDQGQRFADWGDMVRKENTPEDMTFMQESLHTALQSIVQNAPWMATGNAYAATLGMASMAGGDAYVEARRQGMPPEQAKNYALRQAIIEGATEFLPNKWLTGKGPAARRLIGELVADVPGENLSDVLGNLNKLLTANPDATIDEVRAAMPTLRQTGVTTVSTLISGGGLMAPGLARDAERKVRSAMDIQIEEPLAGESSDVGLAPEQSPTQQAQIETANRLAASRRQGADDRAAERAAAADNRQRMRQDNGATAEAIAARERAAARAQTGEMPAALPPLEPEQRQGERREGGDRRVPQLEPDVKVVAQDGTVAPTPAEKAPYPGEQRTGPADRRTLQGQRLDDVNPVFDTSKPELTPAPPEAAPAPAPGPTVDAQGRDRRFSEDRHEERFPPAPAEYVSTDEGLRPMPNEIPADGPSLHVSVTGQKAASLIGLDHMGHYWTNETDRLITTRGTEGLRSNAATVHTVDATTTPEGLPDGVKIEFRPDGVAGRRTETGAAIEFVQRDAIKSVTFPKQPSAKVKEQLRARGFAPSQAGKIWTRDTTRRDTGERRRGGDTKPRPTAINREGQPTYAPQGEVGNPDRTEAKRPVPAVPKPKPGEQLVTPQSATAAPQEQAPAASETPPAPKQERKRIVSEKDYQDAKNVLKGADLATLGAGPVRHVEALMNIGIYHLERGVTDFLDWVKAVVPEYRKQRDMLGKDYVEPSNDDEFVRDLRDAYELAKREVKKKQAQAKRDEAKTKKDAVPNSERQFRKLSAEKQVEAMRTDPVTGALNARAYNEDANLGELKPGTIYHMGGVQYMVIGQNGKGTLYTLTPDTLKTVNDEHGGHPTGDEYIKHGYEALKEAGGDVRKAEGTVVTLHNQETGGEVDVALHYQAKPAARVRPGKPSRNMTADERVNAHFYAPGIAGFPPIQNRAGARAREENGDEGPVKWFADGDGIGNFQKDREAAYLAAKMHPSEAKDRARMDTDALTAHIRAIMGKVAQAHPGLFVATRGGDEFIGDTTEAGQAVAYGQAVNEALAENPFWATMPDGSKVRFEASITLEEGATHDEADRAVNAAKAKRRGESQTARKGAELDVRARRSNGERRQTADSGNAGVRSGSEGVAGAGPNQVSPYPVLQESRGAPLATDPKVAEAVKNGEAPFEVPPEGRLDGFVRLIADKFNAIKRLQNTVLKARGERQLPDSMDAYLAEEQLHGKVEGDITRVEREHEKPLREAMAKAGVTLKELDDFLYAKHAEERNRVMAERNPGLENGSGMSPQEAAAILAKVEAAGKTKVMEALADRVYAINQERIKTLMEAGLETPEELDAWLNQYEHYVPLKGIGDQAGVPRTGNGMDIRGRESKRALGRTNRAESPTVHSIAQLNEALIRARKAEVGRAFLELVEANPNKDLWEVFTDETKPTRRQFNKKTGFVEWVPDSLMATDKEHFFAVKRDGQQYYIKVNDPLIMRAMNNIGIDQSNFVVQYLGPVTRALAALNTQISPEFIATNLTRDVQTALLNTAGGMKMDEANAAKVAAKVAAGVAPAIRGVWQVARDKKNQGEWAQWYREYLEDGGNVGFFGLTTIEQRTKQLEADIRRAGTGARAAVERGGAAAARVVTDANKAIETGTRLSVYRAAREAGMSRARAASLAKNITVNFNRKGELGPTINALYMFFNASVQGSSTLARTIKANPKRAGLLASSLVGLSYGLAAMNLALGGDDDDGVPWYDKVPDYEKHNNLIVMHWWANDGSYSKIPVSREWGIFHVIGTDAHDVVTGQKEPLDAAVGFVGAAAGAFNPLGSSESKDASKLVAKTASPTVVKPFVEIALNEDYAGRDIYRQPQPGVQPPDSVPSFKRTSTPAIVVAQWLNEAGMGDKYIPSKYTDVHPESLDYLFRFVAGSAGDVVNRSASVAMKAARGEELRPNEIPMVRRFQGEVSEREPMNTFWEHKQELERIKYKFDQLTGPAKVAWFQQNKDAIILADQADDLADRLKKVSDEAMKMKLTKQFNTKFNQRIHR